MLMLPAKDPSTRRPACAAAVFALLVSLALHIDVAGAQQGVSWNQWRGPNRDGRIPNYRPPRQWPTVLTRGWKVEVGLGHSSPIMVGEAVFIFAREGEEEVVRRLDLATGKEAWRERYPAPYQLHPAAFSHGPGPKSTPVWSASRLYTLGISGILSCLDAENGKVLWRHDFRQEFPHTSPLYGTAMSPLVDAGLLIAHVGGNDNGALIAFDARSGKVRWRWTGDGPGYSSPIVVTRGGVRQIVTQTQKLCVGVSAKDGTLLWSLPFTTAFVQNIFTPVVAGERIVFGGLRQPTFACQVRQDGTNWIVEKVWETRDATFYLNTPVFSGGRLYGFSERQSGQLVTLDAATGQVQWSGDARFAANAQLLDGGPILVALTTEADLFVFKKEGAALAQLARYHVAESPTWATPAVAGGRILVKDTTSLAEWRVPGQ